MDVSLRASFLGLRLCGPHRDLIIGYRVANQILRFVIAVMACSYEFPGCTFVVSDVGHTKATAFQRMLASFEREEHHLPQELLEFGICQLHHHLASMLNR